MSKQKKKNADAPLDDNKYKRKKYSIQLIYCLIEGDDIKSPHEFFFTIAYQRRKSLLIEANILNFFACRYDLNDFRNNNNISELVLWE